MGGGQLARMLAMVARRSGYRVGLFCPESNSPASHFANFNIIADYHDRQQLEEFAAAVDVITFEFENVPVEPLRWIEDRSIMRPRLSLFETVQNRINEKTFLASHQIPCAPFRVVHTLEDLKVGLQQLSTPAVLKVSAGGYDGKGQFVIRDPQRIEEAWQTIGQRSATLESFVDLQMEISVLVARDISGGMSTFGPIENHHSQHILDWSVAPGRVEPSVASAAVEIAHRVALQLDLVGLICIEYFVTKSGEVLVNEIAPRPHNSGHLTIEGAVTSQFQQQLRTVCGLPVGSFELLRPAAMANLLGDVWNAGCPNWEQVSQVPATNLHLYDKTNPVSGRKMGHLTATADTVEEALERVLAARGGL